MPTHVTMKVEFSHLLDRAGKTKTFPIRWSGAIDDDGIAAYVLAADIATPNADLSPPVAELVALMKQVITDREHAGESTSFDSVVHAIYAMAEAEEAQSRPAPANDVGPGHDWGQDAGATATMAAHGEASTFVSAFTVGGDMSAEELAARIGEPSYDSNDSQDVGDHDARQDAPDDTGDQTPRRPAPRKGKGKGK